MKIKKGLPDGYMPVREELQPLVEKMQRLRPEDLQELDAFMDYLKKGIDQLDRTETRDISSKIFEFMDGGIENK